MRKSGVLMPIFSLPSKYGIGCMSKEAYEFVDFLNEAKQSYWQILPIGPTSYGDSPYQSFSTFAGNPYFIDLEQLIDDGLLTREICESYDYGDNKEYIDYEKIYNTRFKVLRQAYSNFLSNMDASFLRFKKERAKWLDDYALFMALKDKFDGKSWLLWDEDIKRREKSVLEAYREELKEEIDFYKFLQYKFFSQWEKLKAYANEKGIKIVGDIPIYVAVDSADTWANPKLFQMDESFNLKAVAGCPPDAFAPTGQLWGNPLYNWKYHKNTGYRWWKERILHCQDIYDMVRIDHFRGFDEYYSIPAEDETAEFGEWQKGPGYSLFRALNKSITTLDVIAEDLGFLTDSVKELVAKTGYPGMKILEFGFEPYADSEYLPHNYNKNSVVYTGTHDNETIVGWFANQDAETQKFILDYLNIPFDTQKTEKLQLDEETNEEVKVAVEEIIDIEDISASIYKPLIRLAMLSVSDICIIPIQDYLGLDNRARINTPSTLGDNWKWRLTDNLLTSELAQEIATLTKLSSRDIKEEKKETEEDYFEQGNN